MIVTASEYPYEIAPTSYERELNWDDAKFYCFSLDINGKTGWCLPTANEMRQMISKTLPYADICTNQLCYWTSSDENEHSAGLYDSDYQQAFRMFKSELQWVRPIRYIGTQRPLEDRIKFMTLLPLDT